MPAVIADYGSGRVDDGVEHWIAELDREPIGWICCWAVLTDPEETGPWFELGVEKTAAGIDYLVGPAAQRGQGVGSAMIRAFTFAVVFGRHCDWTQAAASPYTANVASWRALEKAGFDLAGSVQYPDDDAGPCTLMVMQRPSRTTWAGARRCPCAPPVSMETPAVSFGSCEHLTRVRSLWP